MKSLFRILTVVLVAAAMISCSKTNETGIALKIVGTTSLGPLAMTTGSSSTLKSSTFNTEGTAVSAEGFVFSQALLGIKEIEIESEAESQSEALNEDEGAQGDEDDMEYEFEGPYLVDLISGTTDPGLGVQDFVPGIYNEFEAKTARVLEGNKSFYLNGSFTDASANEYKFEFSTAAELEFEYESEAGFEVTEGNILDLIIKIDLSQLFAGVDFSSAALNEDNIIIINETGNTVLYNKILSNVHNMAEMEEDEQGEDYDD